MQITARQAIATDITQFYYHLVRAGALSEGPATWALVS